MSKHSNKENEAVVLTPRELSLIDEAQAEFERGEGVPIEEILDRARKRTKAWQEANKTDRSA